MEGGLTMRRKLRSFTELFIIGGAAALLGGLMFFGNIASAAPVFSVPAAANKSSTTVEMSGAFNVYQSTSSANPGVRIADSSITVQGAYNMRDGAALWSGTQLLPLPVDGVYDILVSSVIGGDNVMLKSVEGASIAAATSTIAGTVSQLKLDTATLRTDLLAIAKSTGTFTDIASATSTLASTLAQVQLDTATLAGMIVSGAPTYFTVSPSTGIDAGTLADGVKITTANIAATGTAGWLNRDGTWSSPSGGGDMFKSIEGVTIAASTSALQTQISGLLTQNNTWYGNQYYPHNNLLIGNATSYLHTQDFGNNILAPWEIVSGSASLQYVGFMGPPSGWSLVVSSVGAVLRVDVSSLSLVNNEHIKYALQISAPYTQLASTISASLQGGASIAIPRGDSPYYGLSQYVPIECGETSDFLTISISSTAWGMYINDISLVQYYTGSLTIPAGAVSGNLLTSDALGNASWQPAPVLWCPTATSNLYMANYSITNILDIYASNVTATNITATTGTLTNGVINTLTAGSITATASTVTNSTVDGTLTANAITATGATLTNGTITETLTTKNAIVNDALTADSIVVGIGPSSTTYLLPDATTYIDPLTTYPTYVLTAVGDANPVTCVTDADNETYLSKVPTRLEGDFNINVYPISFSLTDVSVSDIHPQSLTIRVGSGGDGYGSVLRIGYAVKTHNTWYYDQWFTIPMSYTNTEQMSSLNTHTWNTNPYTGELWTVAELNDAEIAVEVQSLPNDFGATYVYSVDAAVNYILTSANSIEASNYIYSSVGFRMPDNTVMNSTATFDNSLKFTEIAQSTGALASTVAQLQLDTATLSGLVGNGGYFTVSPSTGIDNGTLADGVKVTTANISATGTSGWLNIDGTWSSPDGGGDMFKAVEGVAIAESTSTLRADLNAVMLSTGVHKIIAGTNITIDPADGQGDVTINASVTSNDGVSVYPATATANFPYGLYAATATIAELNVATMTVSSTTVTNLTVTNWTGNYQNVKVGTATVALGVTATGTPSESTFLNGNYQWATPTELGGVSVYPATATASFPYGLSASTIALSLSATNPGTVRMYSVGVTSANYVALRASAALSDSYSFTLPSSSGTSGQILTTDGNGNLYWHTAEGTGDMKQSVEGVAIAASTTTLKSMYDAEVTSRTTGVWNNQSVKVGSATIADTANYALNLPTATFANVKVGTATVSLACSGNSATATTASGLTKATYDVSVTTAGTCTGNAATATSATTANFALNLPTGTFVGLTVGSATNSGNADTLDGQHGTYYAIKADVGKSTGTLRTDLLAVKQSTAVTITSDWIVYGATQTYVTTLSTRIASGIQIQPFTISSATARVNGGTSATLRLFITDKNTEFNISAATPIWNTGVVAGTAHTGGTMSNVSVLANQSITAVIDGISGAVVDIVLWVRGTQ